MRSMKRGRFGNPCQRIVVGLSRQPLLGVLTLGDVENDQTTSVRYDLRTI
jgi:hypothetical protein